MRKAILALLASLPLIGCGSGGSDAAVLLGILTAAEAEPNNSPATANLLSSGVAGRGTVGVGDLDFWAFQAVAGQELEIEVVGTRLDQTGWDDNCNVPLLTLFSPDGVTILLEHDLAKGWMLGRHDIDFPRVRVTVGGVYTICVSAQNGAFAGGRYSIVVRRRTGPVLQIEGEAPGATGGNDGPLTAQTIAPGRLHGFHDVGNADWYKFTTTAASVACIEILSSRNGVLRNELAYFAPRLNFFNTDGATLRATVDDLYFGDPLLCVRLPGAGTWFVEVTEAGPSGDAEYQLSLGITNVDALPVETEPNDTAGTADGLAYGDDFQGTIATADTDFFEFSGAAGDQVLVEALPGTVGTALAITFFATDGVTQLPSATTTFGGITTARIILTTTGLHFWRLTALSAVAVPYSISFSRRSTSAFETEPNGTTAEADGFATTNRASGVIASPGDLDLFRVDAELDELVILTVLAKSVTRGGIGSDGHRSFSGHGSALQPRLRVLNGAGAPLATSLFTAPDDCAGTEDLVDGLASAAVAFVAPSTGTFYLEVSSEDGTSGSAHYYIARRR